MFLLCGFFWVFFVVVVVANMDTILCWVFSHFPIGVMIKQYGAGKSIRIKVSVPYLDFKYHINHSRR